MGVRLLHTSDVHLDAPFNHSAGRGEAYRHKVRETFRRIVDLALDNHDLLIVAGDLFDSNRPYASTVQFVRQELERARVPVCLVAGNHDHLAEHSAYAQADWPDNVHVFAQSGQQMVFPDLELGVTGFPVFQREETSGESLNLGGPRPAQRHIAVVHGWVSDRAQRMGADEPLALEGLDAAQVDYVALGHFHSVRALTVNRVPAWYSGAPEPVRNEQPLPGVVLSVALQGAEAQVTPVAVGSLQRTALDLNVQGLGLDAIAAVVQEQAAPDRILTLTLRGLRDQCPALDPDALYETWAPSFFSLQLKDATQIEIALDRLEAEQATPLVQAFARQMQARMDQAETETERQRVRQAYQLGLNELLGRRVV